MVSGYYRTIKRDDQQSTRYRYGLKTTATYKLPVQYPEGTHEVWSYRTREPGNSLDSPQKAIFQREQNDARRLPGDTGHPFYVQHDTITSAQQVRARNKAGTYVFEGALYALPVSGSLPLRLTTNGGGNCQFEDHPDRAALTAAGTRAIARTQPTAPNAGVAQALAELLRDLPKIPLSALHRAYTLKDLRLMAGSEGLNLVFGWAPLIKDVQKYCAAVINAGSILRRFSEQSTLAPRNWHQNSFTTAKAVAEVSSFSAGVGPNVGLNWTGTTALNLMIPGSARSYTHQNTTHGWRFSGAYSYLVPEGSAFWDKMSRFEQDANVLLGTRITADVLWELAPWSWLVDWWAEIGNFIAVNSRFGNDGLVLQYGYLTAKTTQRTLCTAEFTDQNGRRHSIRTLYQSTRLERIRADPFGFTVNLRPLTANQFTILALLGATLDGEVKRSR